MCESTYYTQIFRQNIYHSYSRRKKGGCGIWTVCWKIIHHAQDYEEASEPKKKVGADMAPVFQIWSNLNLVNIENIRERQALIGRVEGVDYFGASLALFGIQ